MPENTEVKERVTSPQLHDGVTFDSKGNTVITNCYQAVVGKTGAPLYTSIVKSLSQMVGVDFAHIGIVAAPGQIETLAFCERGSTSAAVPYQLIGTPCERTLSKGFCVHLDNIQAHYPDDELLKVYNIQSYIGMEFKNSTGDVRGLLCLYDTKPLQKPVGDNLFQLMTLFCERIVTDICRHKAESQLEELQQALIDRTHKNATREIATGIAHQISQPLTALMLYINGCQDVAKKNNVAIEVQTLLQKIKHQATRCLATAKEIKSFLRTNELVKSRVDVKAVIRETVELIRHDLQKQAICTELELTEEASFIEADRYQLQQVLLNLIENAREAFDSRANSAKRITLELKRAGQKLILRFSDNGPGIEPSQLERVFEPFVTSKAGGIGVGLSLVRAIVTAHGGQIAATSSESGGACFVIELPVR